ncbi:hypothetical protein F2P56_009201 [Juglans regia]|uniref:Uncharacterized protein LOC108990210 n=2 Tax=Juglans regia TaxID=51240 RepID=A0A2I4EJR3_JUGRE|nr:uncharacterized protein LOC108990210 [Juglans regia]KAF5472484.1 hypothetical protein F2P56_009201 [Juglans regia]
MELDTWMSQEETRLAQQAKQSWLEQGEANSIFFKALASKKHKVIREMKKSDGVWLKSSEEVHQGATDFFQTFFAPKNSGVPPEEVHQEVKAALLSIPSDNSPGPDGFGSDFYKSCWDIVDNPKEFDKFRPISLCSVFYKVRTKILVGCLSPLLSRMISPEQGEFIPSKSIFENISLTQEMIHSINKPVRSGNVVLKLIWLRQTIVLIGISYFTFYLLLVFLNCKASVRAIARTLKIYETWSGQKVNKDRSSIIFSKHITVARKRSVLRITGFSEGTLPFKYLGVLIIYGRLKLVHLDEVVGKIRERIDGWKEGKPKKHWRAWDRMCKPVQEGGVGIRNIAETQKALHMKFAWKILMENSQWSRFFKAKYVKSNHISLNDKWLGEDALGKLLPINGSHRLQVKECFLESGCDLDMLNSLVEVGKNRENSKSVE